MQAAASGADNNRMRKILNFLASLALFGGVLCFGIGDGAEAAAAEERYVYLGGEPVGITLNAGGLIVTGVGGVRTKDGEVKPLEGADIRAGDVIVELNGESVGNIFDFRRRISDSQGEVRLTMQRDRRTFSVAAVPVEEQGGEKRLGIVLKEDVGGVGTLTFVTENGAYAALGHHVADPETGLDGELQSGKIYDVEIDGVTRGEVGRAGGLRAEINRLAPAVGENVKNTPIGIYGVWKGKKEGKRVRVAESGAAHPGKAQVFTTLKGGEPSLYDVEIVRSVPQSSAEQKGLVLLVSDPRLLDMAGGIVQGMSGSPILQDGALVGAVTHVFLTDPTRGYGVHARFMLDEAEEIRAPMRRAA